MSDSAPWWGSGLFASAAAVLGLIPFLATRRSERRRLHRDEKKTQYLAFRRAARALVETDAWPADHDPVSALTRLRDQAEESAFISSAKVNQAIEAVIRSATRYADLVTQIRGESVAGHANSIDRRFGDEFEAARTALNGAISAFAVRARADLEISGPWHPPTGESR